MNENIKTNVNYESSLKDTSGNSGTTSGINNNEKLGSINTETVDLSTNNLENIEIPDNGEIRVDQIDFSMIASNSYDAHNNRFISEDKIYKAFWGDKGTLTYEKANNDTYLIKEDGVAMGYTTKEGLTGIITNLQYESSIEENKTDLEHETSIEENITDLEYGFKKEEFSDGSYKIFAPDGKCAGEFKADGTYILYDAQNNIICQKFSDGTIEKYNLKNEVIYKYEVKENDGIIAEFENGVNISRYNLKSGAYVKGNVTGKNEKIVYDDGSYVRFYKDEKIHYNSKDDTFTVTYGDNTTMKYNNSYIKRDENGNIVSIDYPDGTHEIYDENQNLVYKLRLDDTYEYYSDGVLSKERKYNSISNETYDIEYNGGTPGKISNLFGRNISYLGDDSIRVGYINGSWVEYDSNFNVIRSSEAS